MLLLIIAGTLAFFVVVLAINFLWGKYESWGKQFDWRSTAADITASLGSNVKGKTILITGANSGIGKETARVLLLSGARVIMACRNMSKAKQAQMDLLNATQREPKQLKLFQLDLSSLQSVRDFADKLLRTPGMQVHMLINNAGIMALPAYSESADGYEKQFATNHLGHFYLTELLVNNLIASNRKSNSLARVINVSSIAHLGTLPLHKTVDECLKQENGPPAGVYNNWSNYGFSKAMNILHANEVNRRYDVAAISLHPGVIKSGLQSNLVWWEKFMVDLPFYFTTLTKSIEQGAATTVHAACMGDKEFKECGGKFLKDCNVAECLLKASAACNGSDFGLQKKVWTLSERLIAKKGFKLSV